MRPSHKRAAGPAVAVALVGLALVTISRLGGGPAPSPPGPSDGNASIPAASIATGSLAPSSVEAESIPPSGAVPDAVLLAVGDIGSCDSTHDEGVAHLAANLPGTIALLGDIVYPDGSPADYANCFDPAWGPMVGRIRPVPGNHDYQTARAGGYFGYFGAAAGPIGEGWYSYQLGGWHVIALNSICDAVGGCGAGSPQLAWLIADLAAHPATCTLAYWHHPRYSSGLHGDDAMTEPLWRALAAAGADLVLAGHDHDYERFAPIDGIRSFVVGTGGRSLYAMARPADAASELRANDSYGLLQLTLRAAGFDWRFVPAAGSSLADAGSTGCR